MSKHWKVFVDHEEETITIEIDNLEARGKLRLEMGVYGLHVICPAIGIFPIAQFDLFPNSPCSLERRSGDLINWDKPVLAMHFYSPTQSDDRVGGVHFYRGDTIAEFESGVVMETDPDSQNHRDFLSDKVFGFFGMPNWNTEDYDV